MNNETTFAGRYVKAVDGSIEPDDHARRLLRKLQWMLLLAASGRAPDFYVDPSDESYLESLEYEDGQITLRRVERRYIEENWPNVNPDKRLTVDWPIRY